MRRIIVCGQHNVDSVLVVASAERGAPRRSLEAAICCVKFNKSCRTSWPFFGGGGIKTITVLLLCHNMGTVPRTNTACFSSKNSVHLHGFTHAKFAVTHSRFRSQGYSLRKKFVLQNLLTSLSLVRCLFIYFMLDFGQNVS